MTATKNSKTYIRRTNTPTNLNPNKYYNTLKNKNIIEFFKNIPKNYKPKKKSIILTITKIK